MDAKKKNASPEAASQEAKKGPMKTFTSGEVSAAIFRHDHKGRTYHSVTFTRWYRDKSGESRYANSFGIEDLPKVVSVAQMCDEYMNAESGIEQ